MDEDTGAKVGILKSHTCIDGFTHIAYEITINISLRLPYAAGSITHLSCEISKVDNVLAAFNRQEQGLSMSANCLDMPVLCLSSVSGGALSRP